MTEPNGPSADERVAALEREMNEFIRTASHALKSPLLSIDGFAAVLQREIGPALSPKENDYLDRIRKSVDRMRRLIDGLLELGRAAAEREREPVDSGDVLRGQIGDAAGRFREQQGSIVAEGEFPHLPSNRHLLAQVFAHLIDNALKYRDPARPPTLAIRCDDAGAEWVFRFQDNGLGFEKTHADEVFRPFSRLAPKAAEGVGLGLAIVRKIVQCGGGRVWAESEPGAGSTFFVALPKPQGYDNTIRNAG